MGLFDRDPTTKSGLKAKPGPVATEKLRMGRRTFQRLHAENIRQQTLARRKEQS